MDDTTCELPDCTKPRYQTRTMCGSHFMKQYRHGDPYYKAPSRHVDMTGKQFGLLTTVEYISGQGWQCACQCGQMRIATAGELNAGRTVHCGDIYVHWRTDTPGYHAIHNRLRAVYGTANQYNCQDCGMQAQQWSYDHTDPNENRDDTAPCSSDLTKYQPRCVPCHKRFDLNYLAAQRSTRPKGVNIATVSART